MQACRAVHCTNPTSVRFNPIVDLKAQEEEIRLGRLVLESVAWSESKQLLLDKHYLDPTRALHSISAFGDVGDLPYPLEVHIG